MVYDWLAFERVLQIKFRGILSFHVRIFSMQTNLIGMHYSHNKGLVNSKEFHDTIKPNKICSVCEYEFYVDMNTLCTVPKTPSGCSELFWLNLGVFRFNSTLSCV